MREAGECLPGNPTPRTVRDRCIRGDLRGIYDGRRWFTTPEAIEEFLRSQTEKRIGQQQTLYPLVHATAESVIARFRRKPKVKSKT